MRSPVGLFYAKCDTAGVTSAMNINYAKPVYITRGEIEIHGSLADFTGNIATIHCKLLDGEGNICTTGKVQYFCFPKQIAVRKYAYPGMEAFHSH